jgi:hypothetical protein
MLKSATQSISIDAAPEVVVGFVADAENLPLWAPAFAQRVQRDGEHWIVDSPGARLRIEVRASHDVGTVDFVRAGVAPDRATGAFSRVVPNGRGSEYVFTRFFGDDVAGEDIAREMAVVAQELESVRTRCDAFRR